MATKKQAVKFKPAPPEAGKVKVLMFRQKKVGVKWLEVGKVYEVDPRSAHIWVSKGQAKYL